MSTSSVCNSALQCFPFLSLPLEIRMKVYRLLLRRDESIPSNAGYGCKLGLSSSILRTCRQVLLEARIILYSENTFGLDIFDQRGVKRAEFLQCYHFTYASDVLGPRFQDLRRFKISVELQDKYDFLEIKQTVRFVCDLLSELPRMDYLHLTLLGTIVFDAKPYSRVLESFTLLRNAKSLVLEGIPPVYSQYLTSKMTGHSPLDHLPKMYDALEFYAGSFNRCEEGLQKAWDAMENDDAVRFKHARAELITVVTERMTNARNHLFDHDASDTQSTPELSGDVYEAYLTEPGNNLQ